MKHCVTGLILGLLAMPVAGADILCYFLIDSEGEVTSYREPPYDLSYPAQESLSPEEKAKRKKQHLIISYTDGPCGSSEEIVIQQDDSLAAMLSAAGADLKGGGAKSSPGGGQPAPPPISPPPSQPPPPSPKAGKEPEQTAITAPSIEKIIELMDKGMKTRDVQALQPHLASPLKFTQKREGVEGSTEEYQPAEFLSYLESEWNEVADYDIQHTNISLRLDPSGKSATSEADVIIMRRPRDSLTIRQQFFKETMQYELREGKTKIVSVERVLVREEGGDEQPGAPGGNVAETVVPEEGGTGE